jgi:hypothetical protein
LSIFGMHAKLIIGGGPHITTKVSSAGGYKWVAIISADTNPELYFQPRKPNEQELKKLL